MPTLDFKGKQHIYAHHLTVPYRPLVSDVERSLNPADTDDNLVIHGDNMHALKALLPRYAGKVKCIYIDPPYNTGNEGWVYNDRVNSPLLKEWFKDQSPVDGEDLERHDKWLCMMWPRMQLLRELLSDNGVIFISIDDNEQHHLRMLMDEVFGEYNSVMQISWQSRASVQNDTDISVNHEYILAYAKVRRKEDRRLKNSNSDRWWTSEGFTIYPLFLDDDKFANPDNDPRGPWKADPFDAPNVRPNLTYEIENPNTNEKYWPPEGRCWRVTEDRYRDLLEDNRIVFGRRGITRPQLKVFYDEVQNFGQIETTWFDAGKVGTTTEGTKELESIFQRRYVIQHPKPSRLVRHLLRLSTLPNDIVLDSFAGSGTTAHAVLALNQEDGGNRKFILVECEDYADNITAERVRRVINGVPDAREDALKEGMGGSFTYCTLGEPIDVEGMLTGDALPEYSTLAAYLLHTSAGLSADASTLTPQNDDGLFHSSDTTNYHLLYEPDLGYLRNNGGMLNEDRARRISELSQQSGRKAVVFGPGKYIGQRELSSLGITFCQLPYEIHKAAQ